jgi:hypothetical protein
MSCSKALDKKELISKIKSWHINSLPSSGEWFNNKITFFHQGCMQDLAQMLLMVFQEAHLEVTKTQITSHQSRAN